MRSSPIFFGSLAAFSLILTSGYTDSCAPCDPCKQCDSEVQAGWVAARHREPNGIGYAPGYSTLEAFYAPCVNDFNYPFLNFRAHVFNNGKPAFNTGIGLRHLFECSNNVIGGNIYWDFREGKHTNFHQIGAGLEWFSPKWDLHLNGYFPVNRHKKRYKQGFDGFAGNRAFFFRKYELAMMGADAQLGYLFYTSDLFDLRGAIGGYTFHGNFGEHASGGLLKLTTRFTDYITAEGQVSYDNHFKWIGQGEFGLRFPFGRTLKLCNRKLSACDLDALERKLVSTPDRFEIIVETHHKKKRSAIDPVTGLPLNFIFVDNTSSSSGTYESPFPTLAQAQAASNPGDVIYVFPGDGTTTGYNAGIILKDNQSLIGSGFVFPITTPFGTLDIPAQTSTAPNITTAVGNIVTLANNNTVRGLNINGLAAHMGVFGSNVANTRIEFNTFNNNNSFSPGLLDQCTGLLSIENNTFLGNSTASAMAVVTSGNTQVLIRSNIVTVTTINPGISVSPFGNYVSVEIENNFVSNSATGIDIPNEAVLGNFIVRDNTISALGTSVFVQGNPDSTTYTIVKNNVMNNTLGFGVDSAFMNAKITNNSAPSCSIDDFGGPSTLQIQSPDLALSGVQTINQFATPIVTSGTIGFVPINQ